MDTQENNINTNPDVGAGANTSANTTSTPSMHDTKDAHTLMGVLAYLGPLVIVPFIVAKDEPFVKFHIKQGLVLLCIEIIISIIAPMFFYGMYGIMRLVHLAVTVLSIIGIVNVFQKKEKELPLVGGLSSYFTF